MDGVVVIDGFMNRIENKHHKKTFRYILSNSTIGYEKKIRYLVISNLSQAEKNREIQVR